MDKEEAGEEGAPLVPTADWGYLRLRRLDYDDAALAAWKRRIQSQPWREAYVFFKHEDGHAARLAGDRALRARGRSVARGAHPRATRRA